MKKLLLAAVTLLAMSVSSNASVITDFGTDPTSGAGAFNHSLGSLVGNFDDQYTFSLDHSLTLTIASVTNVFAQPSDFITGFTGSVVFEGADGVIGGGDDVTLIGPVAATLGCGLITNCQGFAGSAILGPGNYFLDIGGFANGSSGYGGNLATFANETPLPGALWLFAGGLGVLGMIGRKRQKQKTAWDMKRA
jgi:hypothetical protein